MKKATEFFKLASEDSTLKATLKSAIQKATTKDGEVEAAVKVAKDAGFDISADAVKMLVVNVKRQAGELSEDDLENVAGGVMKEVGAGTDAASDYLINAPIDGANSAIDTGTGAAEDVASFFSGW